MIEFKPGVIQSPADSRDYLFSRIYQPITLPQRVSLRDKCPPIRNQGAYGSCVGHAAEGVKGIQEAINYPGKGYDFSPLFVYALAKQQDGIPTTEGTYPRVVMSILKNTGICQEIDFPYSRMSWPTLPAIPDNATSKAAQFKIGAYASVNTLDEVKQAVSMGNPVMGALMVCDNFVEGVGADGFVAKPEGKMLGGHAITVIGYNDILAWNGYTGFLEIRNSWGTGWGDKGYGWIPYDFFNGRLDVGMRYWMESWTSVDVLMPQPSAKEIILWINKTTAIVDGAEVQLDQPAEIDPASDRTVVPIRFLAENFGYSVEWDGILKKITLRKVLS